MKEKNCPASQRVSFKLRPPSNVDWIQEDCYTV